MIKIKASKLKKGDRIMLDCGYCGIDDTKMCEVVSLSGECKNLFDDGSTIGFTVRILGSDEYFQASFQPDAEIDGIPKRSKNDEV